MSESFSAEDVLDLRGLRCPMPLLKTKQRLNQLELGACLHVIATDPGSVRDFGSYLELSQHQLREQREEGGEFHFWIVKG
ncbi:response regulator SirA [Hahella sp. CCB-MM4]|uniref:sulfurtransferase TusA family protein n=1 Tax=Hahella sp. (strain CCB-MM4) TaxID=1926491 RepID=UPI000B9B37DD|nr:sulfurtransferase TusA family protein [Hahella sp. CCB-MM4]OZG72116.1 response regulator SirA [Hahella sp. CCB-MM4]